MSFLLTWHYSVSAESSLVAAIFGKKSPTDNVNIKFRSTTLANWEADWKELLFVNNVTLPALFFQSKTAFLFPE